MISVILVAPGIDQRCFWNRAEHFTNTDWFTHLSDEVVAGSSAVRVNSSDTSGPAPMGTKTVRAAASSAGPSLAFIRHRPMI